ncbi:MAG: diguanylate cyclase, partial [Methylococcales bacterium]|nr:diguanylate cyclase [Methylococcales bacterium]
TLDAQIKNNSGNWTHLSLYNEKNKRIYPLFPKDRVTQSHEFHIPLKHALQLEGELLGYIEVHLDWREQYSEAQQRIRELEQFLLATASILLLFTLVWQNQVIRVPILNLQKASEKMTQGDFNSPLPDVGNDEIGKLTNAFDVMRTEMVAIQEQLRAAHQETKKAFDDVAEKNVELQKRMKVENRLIRMAMYDGLTTLPNRLLLKKEANKLIAAAKRNGDCVAFMFIDLDGFKAVNDNYGHETGDLVLVEMALRLDNAVREIDTVGRFGGDEFIIVLPDFKMGCGLEPFTKRILEEISKPIESEDFGAVISASIGISIYPNDASTCDQLISLADKAMYEAKKTGKNRYVVTSVI